MTFLFTNTQKKEEENDCLYQRENEDILFVICVLFLTNDIWSSLRYVSNDEETKVKNNWWDDMYLKRENIVFFFFGSVLFVWSITKHPKKNWETIEKGTKNKCGMLIDFFSVENHSRFSNELIKEFLCNSMLIVEQDHFH